MTNWFEDYQKLKLKQAEEEAGQDQKGGPGSGHHGHAGRPGQRGGSAPGKGGGGGTGVGSPQAATSQEEGQPRWRVALSNQGKAERTQLWDTPELARSSAEWVEFQGATRVRMIDEIGRSISLNEFKKVSSPNAKVGDKIAYREPRAKRNSEGTLAAKERFTDGGREYWRISGSYWGDWFIPIVEEQNR